MNSEKDTGAAARAAKVEAPRRFGRVKRTVVGLLILAVTLALLEGIAFVVLKYGCKATPYSSTLGETPVESPFHQYLGWQSYPNKAYETTRPWIPERRTFIRTDENGRSITPLHFDKPDLTIVVTGGSTVFGYGASNNEHTIPSLLEKIIHERTGAAVEVVNLAGIGYQSFQEMLILNRYFAEHEADLVLAVGGHNDAYYAAEEPEIESAFLCKHVWQEVVPLVRRAEKGHIVNAGNFTVELAPYSSIFGLIHFIRRQRAEQIRQNAPGQPVRETEAVGIEAVAKRAQIAAGHYAGMDTISKTNGARFVMFLQPVSWSKQLTDQERGYIDGYYRSESSKKEAKLLAYVQKAFYRDLRRLPKPFRCVDLSGLLDDVPETLYVDHCHYNDRGAYLIAQAAYEQIAETLKARLAGKRAATGAGGNP